MKQMPVFGWLGLSLLFLISAPLAASADSGLPYSFSFSDPSVWAALLLFIVLALLGIALLMRQKIRKIRAASRPGASEAQRVRPEAWLQRFTREQLQELIALKKKKGSMSCLLVLLAGALLAPAGLSAQNVTGSSSLLSETGVMITILLLALPVLLGLVLLYVKMQRVLRQFRNKQRLKDADRLAAYLKDLPEESLEQLLEKHGPEPGPLPEETLLSGAGPAEDRRGLLQINDPGGLPIVAAKKRAQKRPDIDPALSRLVLWYLGCSVFWLLFGTSVGEYIGIKFIAPDADHVSWLSFGRLRPVHTNAVFWGWASLAMLGLGYYVVPRVSNVKLYSLKTGWYALWLINASVVSGTLFLMAGVNNGGGEYREYIWPVMALFALGLILTLWNFYQTIAHRTTREIYIANWYIVASVIFAITIVLVAYIPIWQNGLGETIIQGYYMHQGVGMWFMLFTLGIVYYFLPQQLNQPIYSYSLGILAFWTQILFYTLIGTHHFVFSAIPWWLQTVAIVGSAGMAIPVIAGTTNFLMTFKGAWSKVNSSYTLPFFLVGIIFYFTGSLQGTAEAFRTTNLIWHFTDFTVAHSHMTMYGIICFFLWAAIYAIVPRLTGKEPPQISVGIHFWLALIGLLFYIIPLMYGSTLRGVAWLNGVPFIETVKGMAPYWVWRAVGGSLMWGSHLVFAYNMYRMYVPGNALPDVRDAALSRLRDEAAAS
ncbi:cbb3-type cytochrome c oxidase subunit I [Niabella drilacis]|uniref:Cytochrome c oxidase cbb3-type subunit 1 n=1 Tax=Niabella drilacis (strain DSM 25811 / CCM 8410 / CCUG 62505 / LMG 26954 / E90) TaxID=1285928 RepID=A0A1G6T3I8_NIADE|nr:cbb3-type cytochrome c oxidase subunit I [Niabella drilacis]SDD23692.1 cytochrome c oxidase cbb3-type subunit 1 [Niabella drilacis]